jgi:hypothetical protein
VAFVGKGLKGGPGVSDRQWLSIRRRKGMTLDELMVSDEKRVEKEKHMKCSTAHYILFP